MSSMSASAATVSFAVAFLSFIAQQSLAADALNAEAPGENVASNGLDTRPETPLGGGGAAAAAANTETSGGAGSLETITVTGAFLPVVTEVPGGTAAVTAADLQSESIANTADALAFVPGLFAQAVAGDEATRLSSRGSGHGNNGGFTWGSGIQVLLDGLPLSTPYGTPYESFEPNAYSGIEVYRGANAFEYGAFTLGGLINFVEHTGYDSPALFLRAEGGSYGYQREQISSGGVIGAADNYLSITHYHTDGYLDDSAAHSSRLIDNVGFQITPDFKTRFYFEYAEQRQEHINAETLTQLQTNPQLNPGVTGDRINTGTFTFANKTTYDFDSNSNLESGLEYTDLPIYDGTQTERGNWFTSDWSASLRYQRKDTVLAGHESDTTVAFFSSTVVPGSGQTWTNELTTTLQGSIQYRGSNNTLLASNDFALRPDLWLLTGIAGILQTRVNTITNQVASGVDPALDKRYLSDTPRVGVRYDLSPQIQTYANVSRLIEAPQIGSYAVATSTGTYTGYTTSSSGDTFNSRNLTVQSGVSYEIGTRGGTDRLKWDIDYYNEQIKNELLTSYLVLPSVAVPAGIAFTRNAGPTVHEGIEAALETTIWQAAGDKVALRQSYTWGHFYFADQTPEQHLLPGLPEQTYQGELAFDHSSGFYAKAAADWVGRYPVDYANRAFAPSYALLGATIGYTAPKARWRIFVEGQNLTDKKYVSFTSTTGLATASSAVYTPGAGRLITGGATYSFE